MPLPHQQNLANARWTVRPVDDLSALPAGMSGRVVAASVPGCIHTDLIDAGIIRDPRIGDAEAEVQWVSWTGWRYETEFEADAALLEHDEIDLAFDCLDTIATIELNGVEVGRAYSEFLPWRFPVRDVLNAGRNTLAVTFTSPLRYVQQQAALLGPRPVNGDYPAYNMIRKCASNFEWDWGPRAATCGIGGEVNLEAWNAGRITEVLVNARKPSATRDVWQMDIQVSLNWPERAVAEYTNLRVTLPDLPDSPSADTSVRIGDRSAHLSLLLTDPDRWSPTGYGHQYLHRIRIDLLTSPTPASGYDPSSRLLIDKREVTTGIRSANRSEWHEAHVFFPLIINSQPVYCRGANWIPEGLFPRDRTPQRVRRRLEQLKAANMNMIRVWGGGRYQPDWFYDICDELGVMVWHDFMFACACYPEEEPIRSLVDAEARHHVARLSRHPCVVLWCGGNECLWAHESWGFKRKLLPGQTWGETYYNKILRNACTQLYPGVPYIPNSPFSPTHGVHPNDPTHGDTHTWEVWGDGYRTVTPRFCSEFGQQAPSNYQTLAKVGLTPDKECGGIMPALLAARQRGPGGNKRWYDDPIAAWFRPPRDFDEWHYLAQLLQARSLRIGIEWQRANMPRCMGSLIWQLNDAWPGLSWSLIDSEGHPKPAYHAVRAAFRNRLLTIQPMDAGLRAVAVNDADRPWESVLQVRRMTFDGAILANPKPRRILVNPRQVESIDLESLIGPPSDPTREVAVVEIGKQRTAWFYLPDKDLSYAEPKFDIQTRAVPWAGSDGLCIYTLKARTLLRDVTLVRDRLPQVVCCKASHPLVLPGDSVILAAVRLETPTALRAKGLTTPPMMWCANHFGNPASA